MIHRWKVWINSRVTSRNFLDTTTLSLTGKLVAKTRQNFLSEETHSDPLSPWGPFFRDEISYYLPFPYNLLFDVFLKGLHKIVFNSFLFIFLIFDKVHCKGSLVLLEWTIDKQCFVKDFLVSRWIYRRIFRFNTSGLLRCTNDDPFLL